MFFDNLSDMCKRKGTTVTAIAMKLNISKSNVTNWKNGTIPNGDVLVRLSELLDISIDYLLLGKEHDQYSTLQLTEEKLWLLEMYDLLTEKEQGLILGELKTLTSERMKQKKNETA